MGFCIKEYEILPKSASPEIPADLKNDKMYTSRRVVPDFKKKFPVELQKPGYAGI